MSKEIHKRGRYSAALKEKVATEALMGAKTTQQIAAENQISPELVRQWKSQAAAALGGVFRSKEAKARERALEAKISCLVRALCKREIELEWLAKKAKELGL